MSEGENSEPTTTEQSTEESLEKESIEDIAERIDREYSAILERLAAIESELANLTGRHAGYDERFNGLDARFNEFNGGGSPPTQPDHGPEPTHPWFRKIGGKQF